MTSIKYLGVQTFDIDAIQANELSANEEDGSTYNRLKAELKTSGLLLELPVVLRTPNGTVKIISGHHRRRAWKELGHATIDAVVVEGDLTPEEEFNLVNNFNAVRGDTTLSRVKRIIRQFNLDVTKLDLFKMPLSALMPKGGANIGSEDMARKARLRDMAIKLAGELAEIIIDQRDEDLVAFAIEGKMVAVVHVKLNAQSVRGNVSVFKGILEKSVVEWESEISSE